MLTPAEFIRVFGAQSPPSKELEVLVHSIAPVLVAARLKLQHELVHRMGEVEAFKTAEITYLLSLFLTMQTLEEEMQNDPRA